MLDPRAQQAAAMYRAGVTVAVIRRKLRCNANVIPTWAAAAGVTLRGNRGIPADAPSRIKAVAMYAAGVRVEKIAEATGHTPSMVLRWAVKDGIPPRGYGWPDGPDADLLTTEEILAPGPGHWNIDKLLVIGAQRNAAILASL